MPPTMTSTPAAFPRGLDEALAARLAERFVALYRQEHPDAAYLRAQARADTRLRALNPRRLPRRPRSQGGSPPHASGRTSGTCSSSVGRGLYYVPTDATGRGHCTIHSRHVCPLRVRPLSSLSPVAIGTAGPRRVHLCRVCAAHVPSRRGRRPLGSLPSTPVCTAGCRSGSCLSTRRHPHTCSPRPLRPGRKAASPVAARN